MASYRHGGDRRTPKQTAARVASERIRAKILAGVPLRAKRSPITPGQVVGHVLVGEPETVSCGAAHAKRWHCVCKRCGAAMLCDAAVLRMVRPLFPFACPKCTRFLLGAALRKNEHPIAKRLEPALECANISLSELCRRAGVGYECIWVSRTAKRKTRVTREKTSREHCRRLADELWALDVWCSIDWLMSGQGAPPRRV